MASLDFERELSEDQMVSTEQRVASIDRLVDKGIIDDRMTIVVLHSIALRLDLLIDAVQHVAMELRLTREQGE